MDSVGEFEAALRTEFDIDERHIWLQFLEADKRLDASRCDTDDGNALWLKQAARGVDEMGAVIND